MRIDVIVDNYISLSFVGPVQSSDVLDDSSFELDRRGQHERIEPREVEPFPDLLSGGDQDQ